MYIVIQDHDFAPEKSSCTTRSRKTENKTPENRHVFYINCTNDSSYAYLKGNEKYIGNHNGDRSEKPSHNQIMIFH